MKLTPCQNDSRSTPRTRRFGFTLVELLVVIGIIALLISILVPALGRAREASIRVKCLSNLKQVATALRIYATQNSDSCPIGVVASPVISNGRVTGVTTSPQLSFNYTIYWQNGSNERDIALGLLNRNKLAQAGPMVFYCPATPTERTAITYNTPDNVWAYSPSVPNQRPGSNTRISYQMRPAAGFPALNWNDTTPGAEGAYLIEGNYPLPTGQTSFPYGYPKLSKLKNKAILSDLTRTPTDVKTAHREGVNVVFADTSGKWIPLKEFQDAQGVSTPGGPFGGGSPATKWKDLVGNLDFVRFDGTAAPPSTLAGNTVYYMRNPTFPGPGVTNAAAGIWNYFDRKNQ